MPGVAVLGTKGVVPKPKARFGARPQPAAQDATGTTEAPAPAAGAEDPTGEGSQASVYDEVEGDEVMYSHLLPKVMAPFETRSGQTPRKVLIQRRRRQFAAQDVAELVHGEGVAQATQELFPLEVFDNTNFESRTHPEWVPRRPGVPPTSGRALLAHDDGTGQSVVDWVPCTVVDFDEATNSYGVTLQQPSHTGNGSLDADAEDMHVMWLPRVKVCFSAEDPALFARRHAEAHRSRARAESLLRYNLYVDSMPTDDIPPLTNEQVNRMLSFALNSKRLKDKLMDTSALIAEVNIEYARTMNKVVFDAALAAARAEREAEAEAEESGGSVRPSTNGGVAAAVMHVGKPPAAPGAPLIPISEDFPRDPPRPVPERGTVPVQGGADFPQQFSEFSFKTLLTKAEVITAITKIKVECAKVTKMCLFNTHYTKSARLEEMEQTQIAALDSAGNYLKDTWCVALRNAIRNSFKDVGKGWFNLGEASMETYEFSKLRKFLTLTRFMMEDTMRGLVEESLAKFAGFIQGCCPGRVAVHSTCAVEILDAAASPATGPGRKPPLLVMDLTTNKEATRFVYSTQIESIVTKVMALFDAAIGRTQGLHTLEPAIMENLFWATAPVLSTVHQQEEIVVRHRELLRAALSAALVPLEEYMAKFEKYVPLLQLNVEGYVAALEAKGEELSLAEVRAEIKRAAADLESLVESVPTGISLGLVQVNLVKTRELLVKKQEKLVALLKSLAARVPRRAMNAVSIKFAEIDRALKAKATNLEDVDEQRRYIESLPNKVSELMADVEAQRGWYELLEGLRYLLPEDDVKEKFAGESWGMRLTRQAERQLEVLASDEARFKGEMVTEQDMFRDTIGDLQVLVSNFGLYTDLAKMEAVTTEVRSVDERLKKADRDAGVFNSREALLGLPPTDYTPLKKVIDTFDPFLQFWTTSSNWRALHKSWMHDSWEKLHGETVEREVTNAYKVLHKTARVFGQRGGLDKCAENCELIREEVEGFKKFVPLVQALRNPGMRDRHWDQLSAMLGFKLHPDKTFTLAAAERMGLLQHLQAIAKVADVAGKEYSIEQALDKMQHEWESAEMAVLDYRETKTYVIKVEEQISQMLDDHIAMTQSMAFSPYKKPFEERIAKWEQQLSLVSEILDQWIQLQRQWMYLEPIFGSEDIMQQLPLEGKRFATVDRMWRKTTDAAKRNPLLLKVCSSQKLLDSFIEANKLLESVQKGLADYLETKRLAFARFFFLSNDELLQILSQTKNPLAVQPHLRKCFEAIESLDFAPNGEIGAMNSREKEKVPFDKPMMPQGNVEIWLGEVERRMRFSVRQQVVLAMAAYAATPRKQWVRDWPAMVVLAVSAIYWSSEVEAAISEGSVPAYLDKCSSDLLDLTDLVRGRLSSQERLTLGALITIDVHARDVVAELAEAKIKNPTDFEWVSRLRYYWRHDDVCVDMVQASIAYGYEYLGNTPRLVITPLTDRCYMTLMSAMHMNLGGAPAGPAGTGKTETTKDLAKALAKQCVVFNCSDGLDYQAMAKFFKGLASSGAWACFDEFNRIDLEVLSVVAQQILTIQLAIQAKVKRFIFEDTEIDLNPACSVYITMNPGYAGRSELPDNLKALFRPCAMMVPDYALIAEICLYSYGYKNGKDLARKMVATFKLCSEQLSSQDHYDYGMRAVKSVITAAGNLKREFPDDDEEVLLLRALRDVNVPKFLSHDLPLFDGIITDLFPGVKMPEVDYKSLLRALREACGEMGIQAVESFVGKVIQLYETTIVRHGLMLVGPTMGGKTCCYRSLQKAMTKLAAAGDSKYERVRVVALNPKSITMGQLYGEFDENTHEWTDGVLACYMRECSEDTKPDKKWIMFDGPVDAVWIENMNTVLDDNKKLCLVSGEIIQLSASMTMMFEVEDLAVASPATVSRCGMVYMEPSALGLEPLLTSWLGRLPPGGVAENRGKLGAIFKALVPDALRFLRRNLKETVATVNNNLVASCFGLMDSLTKPFVRGEGEDPLTADEKVKLGGFLPSLMLFSIVWSLGASCDKAGRGLFDEWFRKHVAESGLPLEGVMFPAENTVYDWVYDTEGAFTEGGAPGWVGWMATVPEFKCDPDRPFAEIIVPTADTVRYTYVVDKLVANQRHVLCVGETGTGKTLNVSNKLLNDMPPEVQPVFMTFSARTSANQTQDIIDAKMDKRRKGVFGPPAGKRMVIFIDDLNMPQREKYFAQPPIELLRQWMDHGGWYERKPPCPFRTIVDTQFVAAMGPPGGGRNPVTNRLLRHFNFISFNEMSDNSVSRIFTTILGAFFRKYFGDAVQALTDPVVTATVQLYNSIRAELLPTPTRSHYTFNLRDLSKVVQGVMRADPRATGDPKQVLALWLHECSRVFEDRLINDEDHGWFRARQEALLTENFGVGYGAVVTSERLIFGDFMVPGADPRVYAQITDMPKLVKVVEEYLEDYNSVSSAPMKLVMFLDAIEHVSRITRVIRLPLGNALLLGVGGSGRQSLTRLAAYMEEYDVVQIEIAKGYGANEWREDLRKVLRKSGLDGKDTVFLFTDTQIVQENFLEDINNILNSGEVPNLWGNDDQEAIANAMRPLMAAAGLPITKMGISTFFVNRVRSYLHLVLCFSPIGDAFRQRLRMFPSLVNCCTIDWFREWPEEALRSVANSFYGDVDFGDESGAIIAGVVDCCVGVHQSVERKSKKFYDELRRYNYVTPTSYLELLTTFIKLLGEKRTEITERRRRLEVGLQKLLSTAAQVEIMQKELQELQPVLAATAKEVEDMMVVITNDKKEADETKKQVEQQEKDANEQAARAKQIAEDAQRDLDEALPALERALESLKNLSRNDIVEVKSLQNPPAGVRTVMDATCIMFDEKAKMKDDPANVGKKVPDYWEPAKKLLNDPTKFLESLFSYDKDNIPDHVIKKIEPYIQREDFTPEAISKVSKACTSICMWVRAMYVYHNVALSVAPKRAALAAAQEQLNETMEQLRTAQAKLKSVEEKIATLETQYEEAVAKKAQLAQQVLRCTVQLQRADKLIGGLGGERVRWQATVDQLADDLVNVVGDVVISAATIAYSGPFTPLYRAALVQEWSGFLEAAKVPATSGANLLSTLQDPVKVRAWTIAGLPTDTLSVENGIIVSKARRWPLMIDPQGQANKWIKNMERESGLDVIKLSDKDFLRTLENGVRFGRAVLLENIGEALDAALEPLLLKQTFKQGGSEVIKIGDNIIPYHPDFRFYMTTKLRNPHYAPEVSVKVSLLNFFVTPEGLEDQLLGTVVTQERPDLANLKSQLVVSNAKMKKELSDIEGRILQLLSASSGNILDDEELINTLAQSKVTSNEIAAKVAEAEATEREIDETRELYRPVALRSSLLFFAISDLALVDPMYQYSLAWFISLFIRGIEEAPKAASVEERGHNLNEYFTYSLYVNICRSLFEAHKLMFSLLLTIKILQNRNMIDGREWRFLLAGPTTSELSQPNPAPDWLTDKAWNELLNLSHLPHFQGFADHVAANLPHYRAIFDSNDAHEMPLAPPWQDKLDTFQKLCFLRCLRPDKVTGAVQAFVSQHLGQRFIEPPPFDLAVCYKESSPSVPLIFVLSPGADPMADLLKLAEEMKFSRKFEKVSLGQGQGPKAEKLLEAGMERGIWVCLQNCHLAVSWMPTLERIVEGIQPDRVHKDFRLWLTSMPSPDFPVAILQNGVKMTLEPPKGLKSNLVRQYNRLTDVYLASSSKPDAWRRLVFGLCLFHAVIQDRRKFGPLGWNIRYDFTDGDLNVSLAQLQEYLDKYEVIPFKVLRFLFTEINYGGRVTDDKDRRLINNLIYTFCGPSVLEPGCAFSPSGTYATPPEAVVSVRDHMELLRAFPIVPKPEIFGLHENADITCDQNETYDMFATVLSLQPRVASGGGQSQEAVIGALAADILGRLPEQFDVDAVIERYPTTYKESMNTVLTQECIRYNALLGVMKRSLGETIKALKGLVVMSPELEGVAYSMYDNQVPELWASRAYPSLKPLSAWVVDLLERCAFIAGWVDRGVPPVYWISGFFFPQAFLTGTLQNFARKYTYPIDTVSFGFKVMDSLDEGAVVAGPEDGCFIRGLFMEGARWDNQTHVIAESRPKELFTEMPIVWLKPEQHRKKPVQPAEGEAAAGGIGVYDCPVYKTLTRAGTLSTTGHSTNFVMYLELPSDKPQGHWINRGVALFTGLAF
ncbi:hypothetical protein HYH02_010624 [Chlamydomonas schloesseri]|uniref:Uncharacterized protein n=1 Tax=Chlamydomonas schloesseri TaxID=2026947 RepID=A0A835T6D2_9CHLO|nr:hypothetical protein HYH02_010624 [Chlamydomonas schloesseri]|eukprot:KAG2439747.1 hypothetical protein HYH02_010624 [Chlamydomonas schloesseri]